MNKLSIFILAAAFLFASCGNNATEKKEEEVKEQKPEGNFVSLTSEQIKTAGIELNSIEQKNLKSSIKANGMLMVPNQNKAFVTTIASGIIKTLLIQPGSYVKKGQVIATIVNADIAQQQQQLQTTNAQINLAEIELKRQQELVQGNAAPLKNVQKVQTELATLYATRNALQKQLSALGIPVSSVTKGDIITAIGIEAPISGTVSNVSAQIGSSVNPAAPIAEIVDNSLLHLDLFVYEKDLPKLQKDQTIHFTLTNSPGKEYDAQVFSIGTAFANESKTIPVHAVVKGDKAGLIEGMNITAVISIGEAVVPAVPNDALVSYQGLDYIFVLTNQKDSAGSKTFQRVQVAKGVSDVGFTEITPVETLPAGVQIITKGAFFANAKMTNKGEEE